MTVDEMFQAAINDLLLIGEGPAVAFDRDRVQGIDRANVPMTFGSEVFRFIRDYKACKTDPQRFRVWGEVRQATTAAQFSPQSDLIPGTLEWKVAIARDRRNIFTVARIYRATPEQIRKAKLEIRTRIKTALDSGDKSIRTVAAEFGVSPTYVHKFAA